MKDERWAEIYEFPGYIVSSQGRVRNESTQHDMVVGRNQQGIPMVGLTKDRIQYRRSLPLLVANEFVPRPENPTFDTPIHLDGDRDNSSADNLVWRPRWFAVKYAAQFKDITRDYDFPIRDIRSGREYESIWLAVVEHGLLYKDINLSIINRTFVWPTYQEFEAM